MSSSEDANIFPLTFSVVSVNRTVSTSIPIFTSFISCALPTFIFRLEYAVSLSPSSIT
jgi:hypothetical protein